MRVTGVQTCALPIYAKLASDLAEVCREHGDADEDIHPALYLLQKLLAVHGCSVDVCTECGAAGIAEMRFYLDENHVVNIAFVGAMPWITINKWDVSSLFDVNVMTTDGGRPIALEHGLDLVNDGALRPGGLRLRVIGNQYLRLEAVTNADACSRCENRSLCTLLAGGVEWHVGANLLRTVYLNHAQVRKALFTAFRLSAAFPT